MLTLNSFLCYHCLSLEWRLLDTGIFRRTNVNIEHSSTFLDLKVGVGTQVSMLMDGMGEWCPFWPGKTRLSLKLLMGRIATGT